ncbi:hypothetical protein AVEN_218214-1 [Araneus ventricosus]|uniref:Tc1-like transposase DDE domain-containing protein n=1 Tax=Araneus ventricosus TaxID=182803 RepID=A0A4Y2QDC9_ARAVE|nr:hypothetical protein AVEN_218214-1 [Araneus ventricosus]
MVWPARSPVLNPIEHVWDMLGRRIAGRSVPLGTLHELQQPLLQEWALLPQQAINDTIASMPRRCPACISARGQIFQITFNTLTPKPAVTGHATSILVGRISAGYCSERGEKAVGRVVIKGTLRVEMRDGKPAIHISHHP